MKISTISPSSYNKYDWCQHAWYINYNLGWKEPSGKAARIGTIFHRLMYLMSKSKIHREMGSSFLIVPELGEDQNVSIDFDPSVLVEQLYDAEDLIEDLGPRKKNLKNLRSWTTQVVESKFSPLSDKIVDVEKFFRLPFAVNGDFIEVIGIIDQIFKVNENTYEICDLKSGARKDWNTQKVKDHTNLKDDIQLQIYNYAAHRMYPEISNFLVTIYWVKDGGPYTVSFDEHDWVKIEEKIKQRFLEVKKNDKPVLNKSWKCTRMCGYGKSSFLNTDIKPLIEFRDGQFTKPGTYMTKCQQVEYELSKRGMDAVNEMYKFQKPKDDNVKSP